MRYLSFILYLFLILSCAQDDNTIPNLHERFAGEWRGTFDGDDGGTWQATFSDNGTFNGVMISGNSENEYRLQGTISDSGFLQANYAIAGRNVGSFVGQLTPNIGSGIWENTQNQREGRWQGSKIVNK